MGRRNKDGLVVRLGTHEEPATDTTCKTRRAPVPAFSSLSLSLSLSFISEHCHPEAQAVDTVSPYISVSLFLLLSPARAPSEVELEELEQILDEGNQPRLSERGDEDEDSEGGTGSIPTASSSSQSEGSPSPAEPRSPRFYAQVHNSVSGVGKYIVEQAQRPTVVVGAVAGVRAFGAPAALCIALDLTLTRSVPLRSSVHLPSTPQASVGAVIAGPLGAAAGESPLHFTIWLLLLFSRRDSNPSNGLPSPSPSPSILPREQG